MNNNESLTIVGAGMAGLLAGNMLRRHSPKIIEAKGSLPENHTALLRFRTTSVSDATGIPFEPIRVSKGVWDGVDVLPRATLRMANQYSLKVTGEIHRRSITNLEEETRYLAPRNFVQQMAASLNIEYNSPLKSAQNRAFHSKPIISTLPMPALMKILGWAQIPKFKAASEVGTWNIFFSSPRSTVHQTVYNPDLFDETFPWYRATLHRNQLIVEFTKEVEIDLDSIDFLMEEVFGIENYKFSSGSSSKIPLGKIAPIPEDIRKDFISWATDEFNIYSLGRFATWRPGLLLDSLPSDIKLIENMISNPSKYNRKLQSK